MEEIVKKQIDYLYEIKAKLERQSLHMSKSTHLKLADDYGKCLDVLKELGEEPGIDFYATYKDNRVLNPNYSFERLENKAIVENITKLLQQANYEYIANYDKLNITKKDRHDIMFDYLDYAFPNGSRMLKNMIKNGKVLSKYLDGYEGITYPFTTINDSYVFVNEVLKHEAISQMKIIIHEMFHVYVANMVRDQKIYFDELDYGPYTEIPSVYSEISFLDWLKRNKIFPNYAEKNINTYLGSYYGFVRKYGVYLDSIENKRSIYFGEDGYEITAPEDVTPDEERITEFEITESDYLGEIVDLRYAIAMQKMIELFESEKSGEKVKTLVDDFLFNINTMDHGGVLVEPYYSKFFEDYVRKNTDKVRELNRKK